MLGAFLAACTTPGETLRVQANELYAAYVDWCGANGEKPVTNTRFGRDMKARDGIVWEQDKHSGRTFYMGFQLLSEEAAGSLQAPHSR